MSDVEHLEVPEAAAGERLDAFLAERVGSRTLSAKLIAAGQVHVDGRPRPKRHVVSAGEQIELQTPAPPAAITGSPAGDGEATFSVAYQDDDLLVIDKPAGLVVHPGRGNLAGTLAQALDPALERGGIVHRLDKDTSGLLVVARHEAAQRALQAAIKAREVHREYLALVAGRPDARTGTIEAPIGRDRTARTLHSLDTDRPRAARTHFRLLEALPSSSLLAVELDTGRTHQIRVHMQAIGHPVVGDRAYGGPVRYGLGRQFLHATRLGFTHPVSGEPILVESPLPPDLAAALELARGG